MNKFIRDTKHDVRNPRRIYDYSFMITSYS